MNNIFQKRIEKLRRSMIQKEFDTFLILTEENRHYLSGFTGEDGQFDESAGALFITQDKTLLATDSRFEEQAVQESPLYEIYCYKKGLIKELPEILRILKSKKIGFEGKRLSYYNYQKLNEEIKNNNLQIELIAVEDIVEQFRIIKDDLEIQKIKESLNIAEKSYLKIIESLQPGMTEKQIAWDLEKNMRQAGADGLSFPVIAASGPNSAKPHAIPSNREIKKGEPILFDWGAKLNGYCSDISRTVIIGQADPYFLKIYTTVLDAQNFAIDAIKPGISSKKIDQIAREHINKKGFQGKFGHGLGHGVGLAIHELPRLSPLADKPLEQGMIITIEPGIYISGWGGIRIENMIVVTKDGAQSLNTISTEQYLL